MMNTENKAREGTRARLAQCPSRIYFEAIRYFFRSLTSIPLTIVSIIPIIQRGSGGSGLGGAGLPGKGKQSTGTK